MTLEIPNPSTQIPNKLQYLNDQIAKTSTDKGSMFGVLGFGYCLEFEYWDLEFTAEGGLCG